MRKSLLVLAILLILLALCVAAYSFWRLPKNEEGQVTVTDALGRTIQIRTPINRVIITGSGAWPIITAAYMFPNAKNVLYGLSESLKVPLFQMIDSDITSKMVPNLAVNNPNVEEIVAAKPDVVILKSTMKSTIGDSLEELGINVVYVDFENLDSYVRDVKVFGKIFMDDARAEMIANYYNETYHSILSRTLGGMEREKVLFLYYTTKGGTISFNVPGRGWLQTFMIDTAGGNPLSKELAGTGWNKVSFEQIASWNPDIIFVVTYSNSPAPSVVKAQLLNNATWSGIAAVKNQRVYAVPDDCCNTAALGSWDSPGSRWILGLKWMARKINPHLFNDLDIAYEARKFYMEMYGLSEADAETVVKGITGDLK
ncbi:MAG: ABC transporter substrate-binding protein [Candidatus Bathyarchaeia archaeon]